MARYTADRNQTYEFGYARKRAHPNLYERYFWSFGGMAMNMINMVGDGNGYVGNVDLKPEVAHTISATADWRTMPSVRNGASSSPVLHLRSGLRQCPALRL